MFRMTPGGAGIRAWIWAFIATLPDVFRMTSIGDAVRAWITFVVAVVLALILLLYAPFVIFQLGYISTMIFVQLVLMLITMYRCPPEELHKWAVYQNEPRSRWQRLLLSSYGKRVFGGRTGFFTIISFSSIGMLCALYIIPVARDGDFTLVSLLAYVLSVVGVLSAWAFLHVAFALQYATLYYRPHIAAGFDFPGGDGKPGVTDFAYFAFAVGTSFAAPDVTVTSSRIRKVVMIHSILAFFYYAAVFALVINIVISAL